MAHIAPEAKIAFLPEMVERVAVWRIDIDTFTGKERRRNRVFEAPQAADGKDSRKDSRND